MRSQPTQPLASKRPRSLSLSFLSSSPSDQHAHNLEHADAQVASPLKKPRTTSPEAKTKAATALHQLLVWATVPKFLKRKRGMNDADKQERGAEHGDGGKRVKITHDGGVEEEVREGKKITVSKGSGIGT